LLSSALSRYATNSSIAAGAASRSISGADEFARSAAGALTLPPNEVEFKAIRARFRQTPRSIKVTASALRASLTHLKKRADYRSACFSRAIRQIREGPRRMQGGPIPKDRCRDQIGN
jgi:hypothetical protein